MKHIICYFTFLLIVFNTIGQNINISNSSFFDGEPYMAINPLNTQHIVVAWIGYSFGQPLGIKTKVSTNGGNTWSNSVFLPHFSPSFHSADPSLAFDNNGNIWACYIDYRESPDSGGVYVIKSTDGGLSWGSSSKVIDAYDDGSKKPIDRPWLSINPVNNNMYVVTKPAPWILPPNRPYFIASTDTGTSWLPWKYLDTTGFLVGNAIAGPMSGICTASDGKVHCMYPSYEPSQNILPGYIHASSTNDGITFSHHGAIFSIPGSQDTLAKLGYNLSCDPSNANHLAFCYTFRNPGGDYDIYLTESNNGGISWSTPLRVNDDLLGNGKMQELAWCNFDTDGDIVIGWRDRRNGSGSGYADDSEIWGAVKWKDSTFISSNFLISDTIAPYNAFYLTQKGNDFMNIAMQNDTLYAVWGDVRSGILQIYFAKKSLISGQTSIHVIAEEQNPSVNIYPNPGKDLIYFEAENINKIIITDLNGKIIKSIIYVKDNYIETQDLQKGTYIIQFYSDTKLYQIKWIKND